VVGEHDASLMDEISKDEVIELFMRSIHPSSKKRAKLSVHMVSQKDKPPKISLQAAQTFNALVEEASPGFEGPTGWRKTLGEPPFDVSALEQFWVQALGDSPGKRALLDAIPGLLKDFPVPGEEEYNLENVVYITDPAAFRASLKVSDDRTPVVEWGDQNLPLLNL
jgi:insulysin